MKRSMKKMMAVAICVLLGMAAAAAAGTYDGTQEISAAVDEGNNAFSVGYSADAYVTVTGTGLVYNIAATKVASGSTPDLTATLVVDGGTVGDDGTSYAREGISLSLVSGGGCSATVEISNGGSLYGTTLKTSQASCATVVNLAGGLLDLSDSATLGYYGNASSTTTINQSGGTFNAGRDLLLGHGAGSNATVSVSGGVLSVTRNVSVGDSDAFGLFEVLGSLGTIGVGGTLDVNSGSVMAFGVDNSTTGITQINCDGAVIFRSGSTIDMNLLGGFTPTNGQVFDLLTTDGTIYFFSADLLKSGDEYIAGVQSGWTLQQTGNTVQAVYTVVPEPATMGLLGLGLVGLFARRRQPK